MASSAGLSVFGAASGKVRARSKHHPAARLASSCAGPSIEARLLQSGGVHPGTGVQEWLPARVPAKVPANGARQFLKEK